MIFISAGNVVMLDVAETVALIKVFKAKNALNVAILVRSELD